MRESTIKKYSEAIAKIQMCFAERYSLKQPELKEELKKLKIQPDFIRFLFNFGIIRRISTDECWYWEASPYADETNTENCIQNYFNYRRTGNTENLIVASIRNNPYGATFIGQIDEM